MTRNAVPFLMSVWLLGAPGLQAAQPATPYLVGQPTSPTGVRVYCDARWRDMATDDRSTEGGYAQFLDRCLERCPELKAAETQNYYEGTVRRACDASWQRQIEGGSAEVQTYEQFISQCARACPPPEKMATTPGIPELNQLGAAAAPSAGASSASGVIFAAYLAGLTTAATLDATRGDRPASP